MGARFTRTIPTLALCAAVTASSLAFSIAPSGAEEAMRTHRTVFDVRFGAIPIGEAKFEIKFDEESYELGASGKTVGVAEMVAKGSGEAKSQGRIEDGQLVAEKHTVKYVEKSKVSTLEMEFDEGAVKEVKLNPDKRKKKNGSKWVQITEEQLRAVLDPASSIIIPVEWEKANNPRAVCDRTLPVYDGDTRFNIKLSYKSTKPIKTKGYKGYAYVCQLRYVPVAGHKKGERNIEYMSSNKDMELWLAPMAKTNLYTPIRIEVPTWIGTFSAQPSYFGVVAQ